MLNYKVSGKRVADFQLSCNNILEIQSVLQGLDLHHATTTDIELIRLRATRALKHRLVYDRELIAVRAGEATRENFELYIDRMNTVIDHASSVKSYIGMLYEPDYSDNYVRSIYVPVHNNPFGKHVNVLTLDPIGCSDDYMLSINPALAGMYYLLNDGDEEAVIAAAITDIYSLLNIS